MMNRIALTLVTILTSVAVSFAQTGGLTDQATLNVVFKDLKTIQVLGTKEVNINLNTDDDYMKAAGAVGLVTTVPGHFKVASTGGFKVTVKAADLIGPASATLAANKVFLNVTGYASNGGETLGGYSTTANFNLGNTAATLLSTNTTTGGTPQTTFDVSYTLKNVSNIASLPLGTYTTQVIYTIEAN